MRVEQDFKLDIDVSQELQRTKSFEGVRKRAKARRLEVSSDSLTSLDGIGRAFPSLEWLSVSSKRLTDVSAAMELPKLRALCLYFDERLKNIDALQGHPSLAVICLRGTAVERKSVPLPLRKACTWAWVHGSKLEGLAQRGAPSSPAKSSKGARKSQANVRKLLKATDLDNVEQGLHLAVALGIDAFDTLTKSVRYERVRVDAASRHGFEHRLVSSAFKGNPGHYPTLGLVALAPKGTRLAELRSTIETLHLIGKVKKGDRPVRLDHLGALPLRRLEAHRFRLVGGPAELPKLDSIYLKECTLPGPKLSDVVRAPKLTAVRAQSLRALQSLEGVQHMKELEDVSLLWTGVRSLKPLHAHPALKSIFGDQDINADLGVLLTLPKLERVSNMKLPETLRAELEKRGVKID